MLLWLGLLQLLLLCLRSTWFAPLVWKVGAEAPWLVRTWVVGLTEEPERWR